MLPSTYYYINWIYVYIYIPLQKHVKMIEYTDVTSHIMYYDKLDISDIVTIIMAMQFNIKVLPSPRIHSHFTLTYCYHQPVLAIF